MTIGTAYRLRSRAALLVFCAAAPIIDARAQGPLGDCDRWRPLGAGIPGASVNDLALFDDKLIAAGQFSSAGGISANNIAAWTGWSWEPLGEGVQNLFIQSLFPHQGELFVAGRFTSAGGQPSDGLAKWNGATWTVIPTGLTGPYQVNAVAVYNSELIIGLQSGQTLRRWTGSSWEPLGGGVSGASPSVRVLTVHEGDLLVAGGFRYAGGQEVNCIARWDGSTWNHFGGGVTGGSVGPAVYAVNTYQGKLVIGGAFTTASGGPMHNIAGWDWEGAVWHSLGPGINSGSVGSLIEHEGDLIVGGSFPHVQNIPGTRGVARWNGIQWHALQEGMGGVSASVRAAIRFRDDVVLAGRFDTDTLGGIIAHNIVRWRDCHCYANCDQSTSQPILNVDDFICFVDQFAAAQWLLHFQQIAHYANCDQSTTAPVLNVDDFTCFIRQFAQGCP